MNDASGASFDPGNEVVLAVELAVWPGAADEIKMRSALIPACRFDAEGRVPGVVWMCAVCEDQVVERGGEIATGRVFPDIVSESYSEFAHLVEEYGAITLLVFEVFVQRQAAAELRIEPCGYDHLSCGEEGACIDVPLIVARGIHRFDDTRDGKRVDLIAGFHHFLLEVEKCLGEPRLLLCKREDCFINNLQTDCGADANATLVRHAEADACISARLVDGGIGRCFDLQLVCRLYEDQSVIRDGLGVVAEQICVDVERAGQIRRRGQSEISLPVLEVEIPSHNGLPIPDNVDVG
jgi:hypothetical protein